MSELKDSLLALHNTINNKISVIILGVNIGTADSWYQDDTLEFTNSFYFNFRPNKGCAKIIGEASGSEVRNIIIDFDDGTLTFFSETEDETSWDWQFQFSLISILCEVAV